jgi:hypothetical protein
MRVLCGLVTCAVLAFVPAGRLAAAGVPSCTITWDGGASGSWHEPSNWDPDRLPAPGDVVCVPAEATVEHSSGTSSVATVLVDGTLALGGGTLTVTSTADPSTIVTLEQAPGATLGGAATVLLTGSGANGSSWSGGYMSGPGTTRIASGATLDISGSGRVTLADGRALDVRGTLSWSDGIYILQGGTSSGIFVGSGGLFDITSDGSTYVPVAIRTGGTLRKSGGSWFTQIGTSLKNGGRIEVLSGTIAVTGPFRNFSGTTLDGGEYLLRGGALRFYGANIVTNQASVTLDGPSGGIQDPSGVDAFTNFARNGPGASLTLQGGRNMTVPGLFRNEGTLVAKAGSTFSVANDAFANFSGGLLQGTGTIDSNVGSAGEVAPGLSPGVLTISGSYIQHSDGVLRIELTGETPGTEYDRLVVSGFATLGGRLTIESAPGFLPPVGTTFEILSGTRSGQFASVEGDLLLNGNWYAPHYNPANVQLVVQRGLSLRR